MSFFPPNPVYPNAIDSDYTLYAVYNTTETILTANNQAWSEEILIRPQEANSQEIWPDNGFATIEGELLYYDAVEKNSNDRVFKLKRCLRNLGGNHTQFNACGTWIRGFVVAEHHTQIVNAILKVEDFVGENFSEDIETLDWRIRNLNDEPFVFDDFNCPDVEFDFNILSSDPNTGTVAQFQVTIRGSFGSIDVQFGDGTSTTQNAGTHNYSPNANIDPVVIVSNDNCQIVQTPIERDSTEEPRVNIPLQPFLVPIPECPLVPSFFFPSIEIPSIDINIPPIVFPCLDLSNFVPSLPVISIDFPSFQFPSLISFVFVPSIVGDFHVSLEIPTIIIPSIIVPSLIIPSIIVNFPSTFPPISFVTPPTFPPISFVTPPTFPPITFDTPPTFPPISFTTPPLVSVDWGTPPIVTCNCTVTCPSSTPFAARPPLNVGLEDIPDPSFDNIEVQYDMVGFPSEIKLTAPEIPPISVHVDIPDSIRLLVPEFQDLKVVGIPNEIRLVPPDTDTIMRIISFEMPSSIKLDLDVSALPTSIPIVVPESFPNIKIDASEIPETIKVVGFPDVIRVDHTIPTVITLDVPEGLKVPLVFEGPPIQGELKVNWGFDKVLEETDNLQCFALVPCKR